MAYLRSGSGEGETEGCWLWTLSPHPWPLSWPHRTVRVAFWSHPAEGHSHEAFLSPTFCGISLLDKGMREHEMKLDGITDSMDTSWANARRQWRTGKLALQPMRSRRVRHGSAMEQACWMTHNSVAVCTLVFRHGKPGAPWRNLAVYLPFSQCAQFQNPLSFHLENHLSTKFLLMIWHIPQVNRSRKKSENHWSSGQRGKILFSWSDGEKKKKR